MYRALAAGMVTYLPGVQTLHKKITRAPGTDSSRYCYSVWLRHLVMAKQAGLCSTTPRRVAELGPGESIGIGLAALLSGAESYCGLDVIPLTSLERNLNVFDGLVELFRERAAIPGGEEFPQVKPVIENMAYPAELLAGINLSPERIEHIRRSIKEPNSPGSVIRYAAPWQDAKVVTKGSIDMIFSQAVLEHVDDLQGAYTSMAEWLAPSGFISHQIDLRCHATADTWDGHWGHADWLWTLLRGTRPYFINRAPVSAHMEQVKTAGFSLVKSISIRSEPELVQAKLAKRFRDLPDSDRTTSGVYLLAKACLSQNAGPLQTQS